MIILLTKYFLVISSSKWKYSISNDLNFCKEGEITEDKGKGKGKGKDKGKGRGHLYFILSKK